MVFLPVEIKNNYINFPKTSCTDKIILHQNLFNTFLLFSQMNNNCCSNNIKAVEGRIEPYNELLVLI